MAKISELVKTFKLLSDPNAPEWNVKFVGGIVLALGIVAASGALLWNASQADPASEAPPAAAEQAEPPPGDVTTCDPTEVAEEMARLGTTSLPAGHALPSGCRIG